MLKVEFFNRQPKTILYWEGKYNFRGSIYNMMPLSSASVFSPLNNPQAPLKPVICSRHRPSAAFSYDLQKYGVSPVNHYRHKCSRSLQSERTGLNLIVARASKDDELSDHIEVKVDSVRVTNGAAVIFLRLCGSAPGLVLPVHIGKILVEN
jgi:hypothetical protein